MGNSKVSTPDREEAENVKNIQGGKPTPGSLVFDQSKQCLKYFISYKRR
ncbi:hypothetical protein [Bacteroidetes bacterium endosymbiont of Geopemphigus sp.]|nr:hypothetical protein [Bacteroidetes bacterium endosymbiont of Geopemphigus sp.]